MRAAPVAQPPPKQPRHWARATPLPSERRVPPYPPPSRWVRCWQLSSAGLRLRFRLAPGHRAAAVAGAPLRFAAVVRALASPRPGLSASAPALPLQEAGPRAGYRKMLAVRGAGPRSRPALPVSCGALGARASICACLACNTPRGLRAIRVYQVAYHPRLVGDLTPNVCRLKVGGQVSWVGGRSIPAFIERGLIRRGLSLSFAGSRGSLLPFFGRTLILF